MTKQFKKAAIIGVGLIGGSLALTLRQKKLVASITGIGRAGSANLELAKRMGVVDEVSHDIVEGVKGADLVIVAVPVRKIASSIIKATASLTAPCVITDVGSVKKAIIIEVERCLPAGIDFVPGHPIAGTEHSGVESAFISLFQNRVCILTPTEKTSKAAVEAVKRMWEATGSKVVSMDAATHDKILSAVSHLPHMIAYTLVNAVADAGSGTLDALNYSAGGFRDFTRIASSSPEMWVDICAMNKDNIIDMIGKFEKTLTELKKQLIANDFEGVKAGFEKAKHIRDSITPALKK